MTTNHFWWNDFNPFKEFVNWAAVYGFNQTGNYNLPPLDAPLCLFKHRVRFATSGCVTQKYLVLAT